MSDKLLEQFTLRLSDAQLRALQTEAYLRGKGAADVIRDFLDELHSRHLRAYRLLQAEAEGNENSAIQGSADG